MRTVYTNIHIAPLVRIVGANTTLVEPTYKLKNLGQVFQKTLFIKSGLYIFLKLSKDTELETCLHGKTHNATSSFDGTIWELIPKNTFVTLPNLEFGLYDSVANCNIRMKASY